MNNFELGKFLKKGFIDAIGKKPTYKIVLDSAEWYKLGVLTEVDLAEINAALEATEEYNKIEAEQTEDVLVEE